MKNDFTVRIHKGSHITECYGDLEHEAASKSKTIAGGVQHTNFFFISPLFVCIAKVFIIKMMTLIGMAMEEA